MVLSRIDFMRQLEEIDKTGRLHKSKLAGYIYDLVESRVQEVKEMDRQQLLGDISDIIKRFQTSLDEISESVRELQKSVEFLDNKLNDLEEKFDNFEIKNKNS